MLWFKFLEEEKDILILRPDNFTSNIYPREIIRLELRTTSSEY